MGRTTKRAGAGPDADTTAKRKRRRKARRTDVSSSSESSSSDSDSSSGEEETVKGKKKGHSVRGEQLDVEMRDPDAVSTSDDEEDQEEEEEEDGQATAANPFAEKSGHVPPQLRNFHNPLVASRFEEYYLSLVTQEFGDNLYSLRDAKDFDPTKSMPILVAALKQGVNVFDPDEKRMLISGLSKGDGE